MTGRRVVAMLECVVFTCPTCVRGLVLCRRDPFSAAETLNVLTTFWLDSAMAEITFIRPKVGEQLTPVTDRRVVVMLEFVPLVSNQWPNGSNSRPVVIS